MTAALLETRGLARYFGGLRALDGADLRVETGEILGLIGPNGAGKSTLFNCLSGHILPSAGRVVFDGHDVTRLSAARRARLGIARTFQLGKTFASMSVRGNVASGLGIGCYGSFWRSVTRMMTGAAPAARTDEILRQLDLAGHAATPVADLPMALQRRVETARAIATAPKILLLDEPAAGLTHGEADSFGDMVRGMRDAGVTVVVIEHNMTFAMGLVDRLYVLVQGRVIAEGAPEEVRKNPDVISAYLG
jgi:branched-chain amino acid transport system ATP-binding protein